MKILKKDFKRATKIKVETPEDLWNLNKIITPNDVVGAKTMRTKTTSDKGEKRPVYLKLVVEKIHFDEEGTTLRIAGKIKEGPDDIEFGYHTIAVNAFDVIDIEKKWSSADIMLLKESLTYSGAKILLCVVDERRADFAFATDTGITEISTITAKDKGKQFESKEDDTFYQNVIAVLLEKKDVVEKMIVAGPGFTKENIHKILPKELKGRVFMGSTSVTGKTGLVEIIKRGEITQVLKESRLSEETALVEKFLEHLGKDTGLASYGDAQVLAAAKAGAIDILLVSDKLVRAKNTENIMKLTETGGGVVKIIASTHDAGEKLYNLGGFAAILRYKV